MSTFDKFIKRSFDIFLSSVGIVIFLLPIIFLWGVSSLDTKLNGFFFQKRVGKNGKIFWLIKIRTMKMDNELSTTITTLNDPRITKLGSFFRKYKLDELPQLFNVLFGDMSFVGPRPDVPGYADKLIESEKEIFLSVRPGITGPATIEYRNEEILLKDQKDPFTYNKEVIFPDKVRINIDYIKNWSFSSDLRYIYLTIIG